MAGGFSILETLVAIAILTFGLLALAGLVAQMSSATPRSGYMSTAVLLASEKLEDLTRYAATDPSVAVPNGKSIGDVTHDAAPQTIGSEVINYSDTVQMSAGEGFITETTSGLDSNGNVVYFTVQHKPDGTITTLPATPNPPVPSGSTLVFDRRWLIEQDVPVVGVKRITVWVGLVSPAGGPPITFQTSSVRP